LTAFVLDPSIALAWCFYNEATPTTAALLDRLEDEIAVVPAIWPLELGNILAGAERRGRLAPTRASEFLALIGGLDIDIEIDDETATRALRETQTLAGTESLTTYEASYLELAIRLGLPLATKDNQLSRIAARLGVAVI
jgi:predicted nucleic acid-binding protein